MERPTQKPTDNPVMMINDDDDDDDSDIVLACSWNSGIILRY